MFASFDPAISAFRIPLTYVSMFSIDQFYLVNIYIMIVVDLSGSVWVKDYSGHLALWIHLEEQMAQDDCVDES